MSHQRIKVGQIGIGHNHASQKMNTLRLLSDLYEVVGVAEEDPRWLAERGSNSAYEGVSFMSEAQLLATPGLQAVAVETDGFDLVPTATRCLEAGMHLHLDKPGGERFADFAAMIELARSKDLLVQLGYMYRSNPAVAFCVEAVRRGWLGTVFEVHAEMNRGHTEDYRHWLGQFTGGAMYIFGSHLVDLVVWLLGEPDRITPFLRPTRADQPEILDNGFAVMEYPYTTVSVRSCIAENDGMPRRQLTVVGDQGSIEIRPLEPPALTLRLDKPCGRYSAGVHEIAFETPRDRYETQLTELARAIRGEVLNPFDLDHELATQRWVLASCGIEVDALIGERS
ncbi:Gfo/Idh/MocA family oxidoreductase [Ruania alkalisoli]|uniref:Gfo/Idh/MocA family oxidoreductase n=1 Tax=Ruania alkalisoli TaxID=2779775 RepID=A0A7M1SVQ5_9MICO|nr:Gfo/Idh/MocA family oxidoreductase [Ruania alkalisoli]QOR71628.1 Gfo/Idh/MocA family oxidoreductase [Ruania alkalisoli]